MPQRKTFRLSGLGDAPVRYIVDDCKKFAEREKRRGKTYDGIIMDPPHTEEDLTENCGSLKTTRTNLYLLQHRFLSEKAALLSYQFVYHRTFSGIDGIYARFVAFSRIEKESRSGNRGNRTSVKASGMTLPDGAFRKMHILGKAVIKQLPKMCHFDKCIDGDSQMNKIIKADRISFSYPPEESGKRS